MTDIIEEALAMLAQVKDDPYPFDCDEPLDDAKRLLAALADECERLRKQNSEYHRRTQVAEAAVLEETTRGHRLGRSVGRSLANAAASTAMRECERLSSALDAMTNQAVMASGRRATIVTDDGELERLRAENARLREAVDAARNLVSLVDARGGLGYRNHEQLSEAVARLDAARKEVL